MVLIDLDALERNIEKMAAFTKSKNCGVRPHAKSHKSPFIAKKQMNAGAVGVCCQTLIEAEAMILNGIDHVLLTHNLASTGMIERFLSLRKNGDVKILVDGPENTEMLAKAAETSRTHCRCFGRGQCWKQQSRTGTRRTRREICFVGFESRGRQVQGSPVLRRESSTHDSEF